MVRDVSYTDSFKRTVGKLKDAALQERLKKQITEIIERPDIGKPLVFQCKGERSVRVPPFRIIYAWKDDSICFLRFGKRDSVY